MSKKDLEIERFSILKNLHDASGKLNYALEVFGFHLAKQKGWKDIDGMEAVHYYLIQKYHWLPRDVRAMTPDDIRLALHEEMQGWTLPKAAL